MKRYYILIILLILILSSCSSEIVRSGGVVVRGEAPPTADINSCYADEEVVYITKSGSKYHKEDCPFLKSSKIPVSLEQAEMQDFEPCSKCFPDR